MEKKQNKKATTNRKSHRKEKLTPEQSLEEIQAMMSDMLKEVNEYFESGKYVDDKMETLTSEEKSIFTNLCLSCPDAENSGQLHGNPGFDFIFDNTRDIAELEKEIEEELSKKTYQQQSIYDLFENSYSDLFAQVINNAGKAFILDGLDLTPKQKALVPYLLEEMEGYVRFNAPSRKEQIKLIMKEYLDENGDPKPGIPEYYEDMIKSAILHQSIAMSQIKTGKKKDKDNLPTREPKDNILVPTLKEYRNALTFKAEGKAYLAIRNMHDMQTGDKVDLSEIDLGFLHEIYSYVTDEYMTNKTTPDPNGHVYTFHFDTLLKGRGIKDPSQGDKNYIVRQTQSFQNIVGVIKDSKGEEKYMTLLTYQGHDKDTITITTKFLDSLVNHLYADHFKKSNKGEIKKTRSGKPQELPMNSELIHMDILKEKNKAAILAVFGIVQGIETAGKKGWHKKYYDIMKDAGIVERYETSTNQRQFLQRFFTKVFDLLKNKTDLKYAYKNLVFPALKDIPNTRDIKRKSLYVGHAGKVKDWKTAKETTN